MKMFSSNRLQVLAGAIVALSTTSIAHAQQEPDNRTNGGVFALPPGVSRVIAIDAHNSLIAELEDETTGEKRLAPLVVRYVYAGGIARLFGGEVIPTEQFVSPAFNNQNNGNGGNNFGNNGFNNRNGNQNGGGFNSGNNGQNNFGQNRFNNGFGGNFQMKPSAANNSAASVWRRR